MKSLIKRIQESNITDETLSKDIIIFLIKELDDIKKLLTPKKQKVYKQPTNNSKDIIVG